MSNLQPLPFVDYQRPEQWDLKSPPLTFVGEAPGADEVRQGRPFAGRSGKLLDQTLEQAGLDRRLCLIANVFRYQPPGNKVSHFFSSRTRARAQGISLALEFGPFGASDYCLEAFAEEIIALRCMLNEVKPPIVIALGRTPLWALTGCGGILERRGQELPCRLRPETVVIPTFHPSYLLRGNLAQQPIFLTDIQNAAERRRHIVE
ncbi:uracil-DNA glycosylase [Azospirillaceae bacterium]